MPPVRQARPRRHAALSAVSLAAICVASLVATPRPAPAAPAVPTHFADETVVTGLDLPSSGAFLPDGRFVAAEQVTGRLRLITHDILSHIDPMGVVADVRSSAEGGLVGVTFDDRWPAAPYVYVMVTRDSFATECLWRYRVTGDLTFATDGALSLDAKSRYTVLEVPDLMPKHNGGQLRFGPDGMLYVGIGDDGNDCQAQNLTTFGGKILRLDVTKLPPGAGGHPPVALLAPPDNPFAANPDSTAKLVWAYGLRNPFTFQIDPVTSCLYIGDVGNNDFEEIDRACAGGMNFGWPFYEGPERSAISCSTVSDTSAMTPPIYSYPHLVPGYATNAGPLYRTPANPLTGFPASYDGTMIFGDTWNGWFGHLAGAGTSWALAAPVAGQPDSVHWATGIQWPTSANESPDGGVWYTVYYRDTPVVGPGEVHRIVYYPPATDVGPAAGGRRDGRRGVRRAAPVALARCGRPRVDVAARGARGPDDLERDRPRGALARARERSALARRTGRSTLGWHGRCGAARGAGRVLREAAGGAGDAGGEHRATAVTAAGANRQEFNLPRGK